MKTWLRWIALLWELIVATNVGEQHSPWKPLPTPDPLSEGMLSYTPDGPRDYEGQSANVSRVLDQLLKGYDKRLRPNYKGPPVEVGITMFVSSISSISEVDMDFTVDFYFRQHWHDPRLAFSENLEDELCISTEMLARLWWPDTFFANAKDARFHIATTKNAFLRIKPTGHVTHSLRLTVTAMCRMDLTYFPMDSQLCTLEIESYGYSVKDIKYSWRDGPKSVGVAEEVQLPQFSVRGYRQKERVVELTTGNYSRMACEFYFVRSMGYYIIQIYVPSTLIVVLSWVSFWLSRDAVPARVALGITTVLTMTTLISSTNAALPKISYLKSIDVYLVTCFFMVFASLLEFAAVSYISNRCKRLRMRALAAETGAVPVKEEPHGGEKQFVSNGNSLLTHRKMSQPETPPPFPFNTEVRLTSLRKLHTECDLKTLTNHHAFLVNNMVPPPVDSSGLHSQGAPQGHVIDDGHAQTGIDTSTPACKLFQGECCTRPSAIDSYSRLCFPLSFACFNLMYWVTYLNISRHIDESDYNIIDS